MRRLHAIFPVHQSSMVVSKHKVIKVALLITTRIHEKVHVSTISCVSNALVQRTLRSITLIVELIRTGNVTIKRRRVFRIFEFDLVLTPTLLRPIHFTIHLTFRLHAKPDLPRVFELAFTFDDDGNSGTLWREVLPGAIQHALRRVVEKHAHHRSLIKLRRLSSLDGRINKHQPLRGVRGDSQFETDMICRRTRVVHAPDVRSLHTTEQEISLSDRFHRVLPLLPKILQDFLRLGEFRGAYVQLHMHRQ